MQEKLDAQHEQVIQRARHTFDACFVMVSQATISTRSLAGGMRVMQEGVNAPLIMLAHALNPSRGKKLSSNIEFMQGGGGFDPAHGLTRDDILYAALFCAFMENHTAEGKKLIADADAADAQWAAAKAAFKAVRGYAYEDSFDAAAKAKKAG